MANIKLEYGTPFQVGITLTSLATDANLISGRISDIIQNDSNKYLDYLLSGKITTGTSPTAGVIEVWVYGSMYDTAGTYTYPFNVGTTDGTFGLTYRDQVMSAFRLAASMPTTNVSATDWQFSPVSVAALFGGVMPKRWGVFVTHNTVAALNSTASNHKIYGVPIYATSV